MERERSKGIVRKWREREKRARGERGGEWGF